MPRIRSIKPDIWEDEEVGHLSHSARLTWIGLLTQADDEGRLWYRPIIIANHLFPYESISEAKMVGWLKEIAETRMICIYDANSHQKAIQIKNWAHHQRISHPQPSQIPPIPEDSGTFQNIPEDSGTLRTDKDKDKDKDKDITSSELSVPTRLAQLLKDNILRNKPNTKTPKSLEEWTLTIDRMIRLDKREPEDIENVIIWCQQDDFWKGNILSAGSLRKQFDQLEIKMMTSSRPFLVKVDFGGMEKEVEVKEFRRMRDAGEIRTRKGRFIFVPPDGGGSTRVDGSVASGRGDIGAGRRGDRAEHEGEGHGSKPTIGMDLSRSFSLPGDIDRRI